MGKRLLLVVMMLGMAVTSWGMPMTGIGISVGGGTFQCDAGMQPHEFDTDKHFNVHTVRTWNVDGQYAIDHRISVALIYSGAAGNSVSNQHPGWNRGNDKYVLSFLGIGAKIHLDHLLDFAFFLGGKLGHVRTIWTDDYLMQPWLSNEVAKGTMGGLGVGVELHNGLLAEIYREMSDRIHYHDRLGIPDSKLVGTSASVGYRFHF